MYYKSIFRTILASIFISILAACSSGSTETAAPTFSSKAALGDALYHDTNLSLNRTQSCATCHTSEHAFIDNRLDADGKISAVSVGDDGFSLGDRNAPTAAYAMFSPVFEKEGTRQRFNKQNNNNTYTGAIGGQFHDGREDDLKGQAGGPPVNLIEMGMADKAAVVTRLQENDDYIAAFKLLYGETIFDDTDAAYEAMAESIGEFEKSEQFAPFDSRYDRSLTGDYVMTFKELTGKSLFFSQFANCGICHQLHNNGDPVNKFQETFTGYEYHNIGVPVNTAVRAINGVTEVDEGLLANSAITDESEKGKFKVPTLRNVAVTEPYMHNGVFRNLKTVIEFYDHFTNPARVNNPETGAPWVAPEVPATVSTSLLQVGDMMTDGQVEAMVCFLRTLTDQRYEHLIQEKGISCD